jgi:hypothetical protein
MLRRTVILFISILLHLCTNAQLFKYTENLNTMSGGGGALCIKDSLLFIGNVTSGNKLYTNFNETNGVVIFDADSPQKILKIFYADAFTNIKDFISDGAGGFYLCGYFKLFNGISINLNTVIRIKKDLTVFTSPSLSFNNTVRKLSLVNNRLIVIGDFTNVSSNICIGMMALDTTNLAVMSSFKTPFTYSVYGFAVPYQNKILVGGVFYQGSLVNNLLLLDPATGNISRTFNNLSATPITCQVWNNTAFFSSSVKFYFPYSQSYLYSLDLITGSLSTTYNIKVTNPIFALNVTGNKLYLSMPKISIYDFDTITINGNKTPSQGLAIVDLLNSSFIQSTLNTDDVLYGVRAYKDKLFMFGNLNKVSGYFLSNFIATDTLTKQVLNPAFPYVNTAPVKLEVSGNRGIVDYSGGIDFDKRFGTAGILNMNTLKPTAFNPSLNAAIGGYVGISAMVVADSIVFIGGQFGGADGQPAGNFAAYNYITNTRDTRFNLNFNSVVTSMEILNDSILLLGGQFDSVNNIPMKYFMAYNFRARAFSINYTATFDHPIYMIKKIDSLVFFAGYFWEVNSKAKEFLISARSNATSLVFDYTKFNTRHAYLSTAVYCNKKFYFSPRNSNTDTNVTVYDLNGQSLNNNSFVLDYLYAMAPLGDYMVYGGMYNYFHQLSAYSNLTIAKSYNGLPSPDNSIMGYRYPVYSMINRGDSVIYYFANNRINKINYTKDAYIEAPQSLMDYTCTKSFAIAYISNSVFNPGNKFVLEASTGLSFASPITLGTTNSTSPKGFIAADFSPLAPNTNYAYRFRSSDPPIVGFNTDLMMVKKPIGSISLLQGDMNCLAYSYAFYTLKMLNSNQNVSCIVDNSSFAYYDAFKAMIILKWKDGPSGTIKILGVDNNGCLLDTFTINVIIQKSPYSGINGTLRKDLTVYPSIFDNEFTIENKLNHKINYLLYDLSGKCIMSGSISETAMIKAASISSGCYQLVLRNEAEVISYKVFKR